MSKPFNQIISVDICFDNNWQKVTIDLFGEFDKTLNKVKNIYPELNDDNEFQLELYGGGKVIRNAVIMLGDKLMVKSKAQVRK